MNSINYNLHWYDRRHFQPGELSAGLPKRITFVTYMQYSGKIPAIVGRVWRFRASSLKEQLAKGID